MGFFMRFPTALRLALLIWLTVMGTAQAQEISTGGGTGNGHTCPGDPEAGDGGGSPQGPLAHVVKTFSGRPEVVITGPPAEVRALIGALEGMGAKPLRLSELGKLGQAVLVVDPGGRLGADGLRDRLAQIAPAVNVDRHSTYRLAAGTPRLYAPAMLGIGAPAACTLGRGIRIGLIDGPVNTDHPALRGAGIVQTSALSPGERATDAAHGTAVAALMVGEDASGTFAGFAQGARLFAVTAFARGRSGELTNVERIAAALDWLIGQGVQVINMSFAGPPNTALDALLVAAAAKGVVLVAAAGNDGSSAAAYPAASDAVIAVTAVDAASRLYRAANTGPHIEFAAPGVDLYVAGKDGGGYVSGTSYAAPIVAALAAQLLARGVTGAGIRGALRALSRDLGETGRDTRFGWGLISAPDC